MYESRDKMVSHPDHYKSKTGMEAIDVIKAFTEELNGIEATDTGNIIKYALRWKKKGGVQDLEKVIWYAQHLIDHLNTKEEADQTMKNCKSVDDTIKTGFKDDEKPFDLGEDFVPMSNLVYNAMNYGFINKCDIDEVEFLNDQAIIIYKKDGSAYLYEEFERMGVIDRRLTLVKKNK